MLDKETVDIVYVAETTRGAHLKKTKRQRDRRGVEKDVLVLEEAQVEAAPPKKNIKYWDALQQVKKVFEVEFFKELDDKYYARDIPKNVAVRICKSPNYELVKNSEVATGESDNRVKIRFVKTASGHFGRTIKAGEEKEFKKEFAMKFVDDGVAELV